MRAASTLVVGTALLIGAALLSSDSRAGATVDLLFVGINGSAIPATPIVTARPGDLLTMTLRMSSDQPLGAAAFSLEYDLDGDDEIDIVSVHQWVGVPITAGVHPKIFGPTHGLLWVNEHLIGTFFGYEKTTFAALPAGSYQMGTVVWSVNTGVNVDGADILSGLFNGEFLGAAFEDVSHLVRLGSATVNAVPEPATAAFLGLGLLGLVLICRHRPAGDWSHPPDS